MYIQPCTVCRLPSVTLCSVYLYTYMYGTCQKNSTKVPLTVTVLPLGTVRSTVEQTRKYRRVLLKYRWVPFQVPLWCFWSTVGYLWSTVGYLGSTVPWAVHTCFCLVTYSRMRNRTRISSHRLLSVRVDYTENPEKVGVLLWWVCWFVAIYT